MSRKYDIILYGASGFTGRQTVDYCHRFAPAGLKWAIAGRNRGKLDSVNRAGVDVLIADSQDEAALNRLASEARVIATTAGPFSLYGSKLVDACVRNQTHYCDITGETPWIRGLIDKHHAQASAEGTRIIPCCGFDSIPSDYGAWLVSRAIPDCERVSAYFRVKGGANGGTLATAVHMSKTGEIVKAREPFLLDPDPSSHTAEERARNEDPKGARYDNDLRAWVAPFFMGPINTRIVRRSQALLSMRYDYQEYMRFDGALAARAVSAGGVVFEKIMASGFGRWMIAPLLPVPGEGPSTKTMDDGFFECEFIGHSRNGEQTRCVVKGKGDPGNRITVKCLCESAFVLALDRKPELGGVLTPVTGLGDALLPGLRKAGLSLDIITG